MTAFLGATARKCFLQSDREEWEVGREREMGRERELDSNLIACFMSSYCLKNSIKWAALVIDIFMKQQNEVQATLGKPHLIKVEIPSKHRLIHTHTHRTEVTDSG